MMPLFIWNKLACAARQIGSGPNCLERMPSFEMTTLALDMGDSSIDVIIISLKVDLRQLTEHE